MRNGEWCRVQSVSSTRSACILQDKIGFYILPERRCHGRIIEILRAGFTLIVSVKLISLVSNGESRS